MSSVLNLIQQVVTVAALVMIYIKYGWLMRSTQHVFDPKNAEITGIGDGDKARSPVAIYQGSTVMDDDAIDSFTTVSGVQHMPFTDSMFHAYVRPCGQQQYIDGKPQLEKQDHKDAAKMVFKKLTEPFFFRPEACDAIKMCMNSSNANQGFEGLSETDLDFDAAGVNTKKKGLADSLQCLDDTSDLADEKANKDHETCGHRLRRFHTFTCSGNASQHWEDYEENYKDLDSDIMQHMRDILNSADKDELERYMEVYAVMLYNAGGTSMLEGLSVKNESNWNCNAQLVNPDDTSKWLFPTGAPDTRVVTGTSTTKTETSVTSSTSTVSTTTTTAARRRRMLFDESDGSQRERRDSSGPTRLSDFHDCFHDDPSKNYLINFILRAMYFSKTSCYYNNDQVSPWHQAVVQCHSDIEKATKIKKPSNAITKYLGAIQPIVTAGNFKSTADVWDTVRPAENTMTYASAQNELYAGGAKKREDAGLFGATKDSDKFLAENMKDIWIAVVCFGTVMFTYELLFMLYHNMDQMRGAYDFVDKVFSGSWAIGIRWVLAFGFVVTVIVSIAVRAEHIHRLEVHTDIYDNSAFCHNPNAFGTEKVMERFAEQFAFLGATIPLLTFLWMISIVKEMYEDAAETFDGAVRKVIHFICSGTIFGIMLCMIFLARMMRSLHEKNDFEIKGCEARDHRGDYDEHRTDVAESLMIIGTVAVGLSYIFVLMFSWNNNLKTGTESTTTVCGMDMKYKQWLIVGFTTIALVMSAFAGFYYTEFMDGAQRRSIYVSNTFSQNDRVSDIVKLIGRYGLYGIPGCVLLFLLVPFGQFVHENNSKAMAKMSQYM